LVAQQLAARHGVGARIGASGLEQAPQWRTLEAIACDLPQGQRVAAPMAGAMVPGWTIQGSLRSNDVTRVHAVAGL